MRCVRVLNTAHHNDNSINNANGNHNYPRQALGIHIPTRWLDSCTLASL